MCVHQGISWREAHHRVDACSEVRWVGMSSARRSENRRSEGVRSEGPGYEGPRSEDARIRGSEDMRI